MSSKKLGKQQSIKLCRDISKDLHKLKRIAVQNLLLIKLKIDPITVGSNDDFVMD